MFLVDGFSTIIQIAGAAGNIFLREREVQPGEIDGGGPIDTTTMLNAVMETQTFKSLKKFGATKSQCQYDPNVYTQLMLIVNTLQFFTIFFPDGQTLPFYGWVNKFTPQSLKIGEFPLGELEILPTNRSMWISGSGNAAEFVLTQTIVQQGPTNPAGSIGNIVR